MELLQFGKCTSISSSPASYNIQIYDCILQFYQLRLFMRSFKMLSAYVQLHNELLCCQLWKLFSCLKPSTLKLPFAFHSRVHKTGKLLRKLFPFHSSDSVSLHFLLFSSFAFTQKGSRWKLLKCLLKIRRNWKNWQSFPFPKMLIEKFFPSSAACLLPSSGSAMAMANISFK